MRSVTLDSKQVVQDYLRAVSGQPKTEKMLRRYTSDSGLVEHILQAEAAFPSYEVIPHQMVAEGDLVAARCTLHGIQQGEFAGIPPTGKPVSSDFMIFYRVVDGVIVAHWMQFNPQDIISQLTA